jgi:hypothetical protein
MLADLLPHQVEGEVEVDDGPDEEVDGCVGECDESEQAAVPGGTSPAGEPAQRGDGERRREEAEGPRPRRDLQRLDRVRTEGAVRCEPGEPRGR